GKLIEGNKAIVIVFDHPVRVTNPQSPIDSHVFQLLMEDPEAEQKTGFLCRCPIRGNIVPVKPTVSGAVVTAAQTVPGPDAFGVAFIVDPKLGVPQQEILRGKVDVWVMLRGDFVLDTGANNNNIPRAIDAEF